MQFKLANLALASLAIAAPTAPIEERQTTVTGSLLTILSSFQTTSLGSVKIIRTFSKPALLPRLDTHTDSPAEDSGAAAFGQATAAAEVAQKLIIDNVRSISAAATASAGLLTGEIGKLPVTTSEEVSKLSVEQRRQIAEAVVTLQTAVAGIQPIYDIQIKDFTPELRKIIDDEVKLVQSSIGPLINPVAGFASLVVNNAPKADFDVVGIPAAIAELRSVVDKQIAFIGLGIDLNKAFPALALPAASGLPSASVPAIALPSISAPAIAVPSISVPSVPAPSISVPAIAVPSISAPAVPSISVPAIALPKITPPAAGLPTRPLAV